MQGGRHIWQNRQMCVRFWLTSHSSNQAYNVKYTYPDQTFSLRDQYPSRQKYLRTTPPPYYQIWPINCYTVYRRRFAVCLVLEFHRPITRLIFLLSYPLNVLNLLVISCNRHYFRKIYSMLIRIQEVRSFLHLSCFSMIRELVKGGNVFLP